MRRIFDLDLMLYRDQALGMDLSGLHVPLITPFTADDRLDTAGLERLADDVLSAGAVGLVALGTTGEPATLAAAEKRAVLDVCAQACADHGAMLTVGAGSNATAATVAAVGEVDRRAGAVLVVVPYYTRPSAAGVIAHFRAVAAASPLPVIVYDVPARTGRILGFDAVTELAATDGVVGFKHAPGVLGDTTMRLLADRADGVAFLAGDDVTVSATLALGADGAILASANVAPREYAALVAAWAAGRVDEARTLGHALVPLAVALFAEPNPVVIKAVLAAQGRIASPAVRLPLLTASRAATDSALAAFAAAVWERRIGLSGTRDEPGEGSGEDPLQAGVEVDEGVAEAGVAAVQRGDRGRWGGDLVERARE
ncbi:4-hydroxy-tetrahydrodipicolinate synthase [Tsukamurella soli]|uniref:4-hydroxy-tetrahydrodipicolinate synthase n=1 Tax=Tsukamurella soli TaxID=644556 RepID=UPI0031E9E79E